MSVSGILNVDKEAGLTSFQAVALVRRGTGVRRVGHAGTLDPMATGVLLVCVGQAARVTEYLVDLRKVYRARIVLGVATDTYDAEGAVTSSAAFAGVSQEQVEAGLQRFAGAIEQTPPAYSAVKVHGQRAYRLARKGEPFALAPRPVRVYRIGLLAFEPPSLEVEVECGKGTYIRSIAHDLGQQLGCGAHLAALARTRVGPFGVAGATGTQALREAFESGGWRELLLPVDHGLMRLPAVTLGMAEEQDVRHGQAVQVDAARMGPAAECRAYAEDGGLIGILAYDAPAGAWRPRKVFAPGGEE